MSCLASIIKIYPNVFILSLDKNCVNSKLLPKNASHQQISDVILFDNHSDPQLRGLIRLVLANFVTTILETYPDYLEWLAEHCKGENSERLQMENIVNIFINVR